MRIIMLKSAYAIHVLYLKGVLVSVRAINSSVKKGLKCEAHENI